MRRGGLATLGVGIVGVLAMLVGLVGLGGPSLAAAPSADLPQFRAPVVDTAGVVPNAVEQSVAAALEDYQRRSGRQIAVAVINTTANQSLEDYTIDLARAWGVGTKGRDDGVLLLIAVRDRRVRIEVGGGLEGRLTDLESGRIIRERLVPLLAAGRYGAAVQQGTDAIRTALGDRQVGALPPASQPVVAENSHGASALLFPVLAIGLLVASLFGRRRRRRRWGGMGVPIIWGGGLGGFGGGGLGGGGFGGGGGGFGGGGGGGFSGGGASGGW
jgi:uncharacterized protein